jgi:hypothetical protein
MISVSRRCSQSLLANGGISTSINSQMSPPKTFPNYRSLIFVPKDAITPVTQCVVKYTTKKYRRETWYLTLTDKEQQTNEQLSAKGGDKC